ncbi:MAG TPA: xanthine dehydrogenase family protein subunit M [Rhizomicrobium sp.]|jgi:carbon-monoxide dehydrogenase medium subunit|nr:xanthine dehydrogenase family protein subunit M [Rhizomicrobium sp.]
MIPYPFTYHRATSLAEAQSRLKGEAKLLAGGQTLVAAMKLRLAAPSDLIDISQLKELSFVRREGGTLLIGAGTTHHEVATSQVVAASIPALQRLAEMIGDPAVRYRGTLGGSIANNDPAADYPAALVGLGATVRTTRRDIAAGDFFTGMFATALDEDEIVTQVRFPVPERAAYQKFRNPASRFALAGVFVAKTGAGARVAVIGAGPCVFRVPEMERALDNEFRPDAIRDIAIDPAALNSDIHAGAEYRAHLVGVLARRAVESAVDNAAADHSGMA